MTQLWSLILALAVQANHEANPEQDESSTPTPEERVVKLEQQAAERAEEEKPSWADRVKIHGAMRYRHEYLHLDEGPLDRHRHRIRAKLGVTADPLEFMDFGFELTTGETVDANGHDVGDPISGNQTLTDAWGSRGVWISQAFLAFHPEQTPGLHAIIGKMNRPFITPAGNELIWDSDVNPEGGCIKYRTSHDDLEFILHGYGFWVIERSAGADSALFGGQAALKRSLELFEDKAHLMGGASYYNYIHVQGEPFLVDGNSFGNTTDFTNTLFAEDFNLVELFIELGFRVQEIPVLLFGDYVRNIQAEEDNDTGWCAGFKIGDGKKPGSWDLRYQYRKTGRDAVFGTFADSDFGEGGTNSKGHEVNVGYVIAKGLKCGVTVLLNDVNLEPGPEDEFLRVMTDVSYKF